MSTKQQFWCAATLVASVMSGVSPVADAHARAAAPVDIAAESAEFVLVNNTSVWLSLFIDGVRSVSVPPGDRGVDFVTPGDHSFVAYTLDSTGRSASDSGDVGPAGQTWTISEN